LGLGEMLNQNMFLIFQDEVIHMRGWLWVFRVSRICKYHGSVFLVDFFFIVVELLFEG
jgi:hypothetical protein